MLDIDFYPAEADAADYPRPVLSMLAQPSWRTWLGRRGVGAESAFLNGGESFASGRYALAEAMRCAGVGVGGAVLLPAFHCRVVVEAAIYLGADVRFYPVTADLRPDFEALSTLASGGDAPVAMVLTHYFGFPNAIDESVSFCKAHGIALIEDCAHALYAHVLYGSDDARMIGRCGDYAVASLWKFLPVMDGAVLLDNTRSGAGRPVSAQPMVAEIKAIAMLITGWLKRSGKRQLPSPEIRSLVDEARLIGARRVERAGRSGLTEFDPSMVLKAALRSSRWLSAMADHGWVVRKRREHYLSWLQGMRDVVGVTPLFTELPAGVVPYAFPLLVDAPEVVFHRLKMAGIPIWRWENMAVTECAISRDYRLRLLQLPCHQDLHSDEIEWLVRMVKALLFDRDE